MKRIVIPVMALIMLMLMSFTTNTSSIEIVETESELKNVELLSLNDLEILEKTSLIGRRARRHSPVLSRCFIRRCGSDDDDDDGRLKLDEILNKY